MCGEAQCMPLIILGGHCHAPNLTMLVVFVYSHVFKAGELCEVTWVLCLLFSCVHDLFMFIVVYVCAILLLFVIDYMCVGFKSQDQQSSTCDKVQHAPLVLSNEKYHDMHSSIGVFYLLMCF
jgi:hypothetical protein